MNEKKSIRHTFEETLEAQEGLRQKLDELVKEDRPLEEDERGDFLELVSRSLLGEGIDQEAFQGGIVLTGEELEGIVSENVETFLRVMAYLDRQSVNLEKVGEHSISFLWKVARETALSVFPYAVSVALQVSPEKDLQEKKEARRDW